ncbi:MAG: AAA family ATPase [Acidimicrobiaceae bacterium]|nr:AAA family ATPase [Acidimicrobiaceae bacterium]MYA74843.1 AAA family ATPase [Acidimicrobiaceae bacterium]MYC41015.1 AAA family ATPase [Acidimicrobiaceae bacterium]MYG56638.1 AAA family ATPase [Acidimicrobiaceae bacterium]MYH87718.1 AAA family ATPase [Acidimicrobiaceae bacterium]
MKLHPREFTAEPNNPFANDQLGRRAQVTSFCQMLIGAEGHAVVSLDGPWGSGKTAFVKMCAAHLRSSEVQETRPVRVIEFNAWHQGHTGNPLVDLVSAISAEISDPSKRLIQTAIKLIAGGASQMIRAASGGALDLGALTDDKNQELTAAWEQTEQGRNEFQSQLGAAAKSDGLILLIDELDRCKPTYALELLSTVRHLFDVPGVIVVLAINRAELAHSVQSVYGPNFSADHYLRRFADLHVQLLRPTQPALIPLFQQLIGQAGESSLGYRGIWEMLSLVGEAQGCGLRDIQQAAHHYSAVIATYGTTPLRDPNNLRYSIAALIAFRALDRNSYQSMTKGQIDGFQAIAAVRQSLTPMGASQPSVADKDVKDLEAILFDFASITQLDINEFPPPDLKEDDFLREYQSAIGSDDGNPAEVFRTYKSWKDAMYWLSSPESVKAITIRIDMLSTA